MPETYSIEEEISKNKELISKYPWLNPEKDNVAYDYSYTFLDSMPVGWKIAFGEEMCAELQKELEHWDYVDKYQVVQVKEKFGGLRWYTDEIPIGKYEDDYIEFIGYKYDKHKEDPDFYPEDQYYWEFIKLGNNMDSEIIYHIHKWVDKCMISEIVDKYYDMSYKTCSKCGKPAQWVSNGWVRPFCTDCANKIIEEQNNKQSEVKITINDYFNNIE